MNIAGSIDRENTVVTLDRKVFADANVLHNKMNCIKISVNLRCPPWPISVLLVHFSIWEFSIFLYTSFPVRHCGGTQWRSG
jgi:hypothetical protein